MGPTRRFRKAVFPLIWLAASPLASAAPTHQRSKNGVSRGRARAADSATALQRKIYQRLASSAQYSWELGAWAEALTEYAYPSLSVFSTSSIPPPLPTPPADLLAIVQPIVSSPPKDSLSLMADDAAADPASLGVAVLMASRMEPAAEAATYALAGEREVDYLLTDVPRTGDAISHRAHQKQFWADSVSMVPPFLAYYGALHSNLTLLTESYTQCFLYRAALQDAPTKLWRHIGLGTFTDPNLWSTGNGWATYGMLRVAATFAASKEAGLVEMHADLLAWAGEIVESAWGYQDASSGLLYNYIDQPATFLEAAGTALIAASTFRLYTLTSGSSPSSASLAAAKKAYTSIFANNVDPQTGRVSPVADPLHFAVPAKHGATSPEAQAFVLEMYSAWRDSGLSM